MLKGDAGGAAPRARADWLAPGTDLALRAGTPA